MNPCSYSGFSLAAMQSYHTCYNNQSTQNIAYLCYTFQIQIITKTFYKEKYFVVGYWKKQRKKNTHLYLGNSFACRLGSAAHRWHFSNKTGILFFLCVYSQIFSGIVFCWLRPEKVVFRFHQVYVTVNYTYAYLKFVNLFYIVELHIFFVPSQLWWGMY